MISNSAAFSPNAIMLAHWRLKNVNIVIITSISNHPGCVCVCVYKAAQLMGMCLLRSEIGGLREQSDCKMGGLRDLSVCEKRGFRERSDGIIRCWILDKKNFFQYIFTWEILFWNHATNYCCSYSQFSDVCPPLARKCTHLWLVKQLHWE